jgi:arsenate reductase (thioredoxin)
MNPAILKTFELFSEKNIPVERLAILQPLVHYIQEKVTNQSVVRLNFICTHNSRRSHLSQIWAQTMAYHFGIKNVYCYSGGTEATAMFPKVGETLLNQGFEVIKLSVTENPVYALKYNENEAPVICFSKKYDSAFNPTNNYAAILTCDNADNGCPIILGADARIPVKYNDPKLFDSTDLQAAKYAERSLEIAQEMWYVFKQIKP